MLDVLDPTLLSLVAGGVVATGVGIVAVHQTRRAERAERQAHAQRTVIEQLDQLAGDSAPTPSDVLRHHHTFGPKDADGIRVCRCGDRYTDGMDVREK